MKSMNYRPTPYLLLLMCPLYTLTNIPTQEGINACRKALNHRSVKSVPTETICDLMRMIPTMKNFLFNNEHFRQQHGTAMGT